MVRNSLLFFYIIPLSALFSDYIDARTKAYALVIGNNDPATNSHLKKLHFADDDAVRYYHFFTRFSEDVFLMTIPDSTTQSRYPRIASVAHTPSLLNFEKDIELLKEKMIKDRSNGHELVFYLAYSGHGNHDDNGEPYLTLQDGGITHQVLHDALVALDADYSHLFIDACYAEGVVGSRGTFSEEIAGNHISLSGEVVEAIIGRHKRPRLPGLGIILASSAYQQTHEWSQIESGIFTHEVLSGLNGPADINMDGKIEYSELVAFISAANRNVKDTRGRIKVIAEPPTRNHRVPLVDFRTLSNVAFLTGDPSDLGHFYIELENGERYLDANIGDMNKIHVAAPLEGEAYLHSKNKMAILKTGPSRIIELGALRYVELSNRERGSIELAFLKGLFSAEYGRRYYDGFVDSSGLTSVQFDERHFSPHSTAEPRNLYDNLTLRKKMAGISFFVAGVSTVMAVTFGTLSLSARNDFENTDFHKPSVQANSKYKAYSSTFWASASLVPLAALAGWVFMPGRKHKEDSSITVSIGRDKMTLISIGF